jgi:hypothetical protein
MKKEGKKGGKINCVTVHFSIPAYKRRNDMDKKTQSAKIEELAASIAPDIKTK